MPALEEICAYSQRLASCKNLAEAKAAFAKALLELGQAEALGIFFLDQSKEKLVLRHLLKGQEEITPEEEHFVRVDNFDDLLSFSLCSGKNGFLQIVDNTVEEINANSLSTSILCALCKQHFSYAQALLLTIPGGTCIGGALLLRKSSRPSEVLAPEVYLYALYAASVLNFFIQKQSHHHILKSLDNDISRLEKQKKVLQLNDEMGIVGKSEEIERVRYLIRKAAPSDAAVLICGETGTGKELVAEAIHENSSRCKKAFVKINCAAIPPNLLESELFGYRKGAFSGANADYLGLLRSAQGGTLFLDEIGDMSVELQAKLLRFLQEKRVHPIGDTKSYPVDIRILAATNCNLESAVEKGTFRRDMYHRLAVFPINLPSLDLRKSDVPYLAEHFLNHAKRRHSRPKMQLSKESIHFLCGLNFPGNVRELEAYIERAVLMAEEDTDILGLELFLPNTYNANGQNEQQQKQTTLPESVEQYELKLINNALSVCTGNQKDAANFLGIPRRTLAHKLQKLGVKYKREAN